MKLKEVLKKATPLPLELIVGAGTCFHEGNTVSIQKLHEPSEDSGFEEAGETIAEFWPGQNDIDKVDGALMLHCRKKFEKLVDEIRLQVEECHAWDQSCDNCDRLRKLLAECEEVDGI